MVEFPYNNDYLYLSSGSDDDSKTMTLNRSQSQGLLFMTGADREALKNYMKWNE